jgi:hypothetical protein
VHIGKLSGMPFGRQSARRVRPKRVREQSEVRQRPSTVIRAHQYSSVLIRALISAHQCSSVAVQPHLLSNRGRIRSFIKVDRTQLLRHPFLGRGREPLDLVTQLRGLELVGLLPHLHAIWKLIRSMQRHAEASRGEQRLSGAIRGKQRQAGALT